MTEQAEINASEEVFEHCGHTIARNPEEPFRVFNSQGHLICMAAQEPEAKAAAARSRVKELVSELSDITNNHLY